MDKAKNDKSCWNCVYHNIKGENLLGKCSWFRVKKKQEEKEIPPGKVDIGCKFFERKK